MQLIAQIKGKGVEMTEHGLTVMERIKRKCRISTTRSYNGTPCLLWIGAKVGKGYGHISVEGEMVRVHRIVYEHNHGQGSLDGLDVHHLCGNPDCQNHQHIIALSRADHMKLHIENGDFDLEKFLAGGREASRQRRKLTPDQVRQIRLLGGVEPMGAIAQRFGVDRMVIRYILDYKTYQEV